MYKVQILPGHAADSGDSAHIGGTNVHFRCFVRRSLLTTTVREQHPRYYNSIFFGGLFEAWTAEKSESIAHQIREIP